MTAPSEVIDAANSLIGLPCWYVSGGGSAGTAFSLELGLKRLRQIPVKNAAHTEEYRNFEGEASLLIWCSWRLESSEEALASSDEKADVGIGKLERGLVGRSVRDVAVLGRACDLRIAFDDLFLNVFCDHVPGDPSYSGNWQIHRGARLIAVGPGFEVAIE